jgi:hypothetical protein
MSRRGTFPRLPAQKIPVIKQLLCANMHKEQIFCKVMYKMFSLSIVCKKCKPKNTVLYDTGVQREEK